MLVAAAVIVIVVIGDGEAVVFGVGAGVGGGLIARRAMVGTGPNRDADDAALGHDNPGLREQDEEQRDAGGEGHTAGSIRRVLSASGTGLFA